MRVRRSRADFANGLADVATLAVAAGDHAQAARFFGAADSLRGEDGAPFPLPARTAYEGAAAAARSRLGDATWTRAYAAGAALPMDDALAEAEAIVADPLGDRPRSASVVAFRQPRHAGRGDLPPLTRRERGVLAHLCQRLTDPEIAERLFISPRTASAHVANILSKLGAANRREAAVIAIQQGLA